MIPKYWRCMHCSNVHWPTTGLCWKCDEAGILPPKRIRKQYAKLKRRAVMQP